MTGPLELAVPLLESRFDGMSGLWDAEKAIVEPGNHRRMQRPAAANSQGRWGYHALDLLVFRDALASVSPRA